MHRLLVLVVLLTVCVLPNLARGYSGHLEIKTRNPTLLVGSYLPAGSAPKLNFVVQPGAFALTDGTTGAHILSFVDYGAFTHVLLAGAEFLISADTSVAKPVLELSAVTPNQVLLPSVEPSSLQPVEANSDVFEAFAAKFSTDQADSASRHMVSVMQDLVAQTPVSWSLIHLSAALASEGISGVSLPSALPLHLTALRVAKHRPDLGLGAEVLRRANGNTTTATLDSSIQVMEPQACRLSDTCGNACFGRCGLGCACWKWVCGDCDCHQGCWQHDCCCSCRGMLNICCVNIVAFRCGGYKNSCSP